MTAREILNYIIKREDEGAGDPQIDDELIAMGVTEEEIDEANDIYANEYPFH